MAFDVRRRWDLVAASAAVIALLMAAAYLALIGAQGGPAALWFVAGLAVSAALAGYGARRAAPRRTPALAVAGAILVALGLLGILSIGLPILAAGVLALIAAARATTPDTAT